MIRWASCGLLVMLAGGVVSVRAENCALVARPLIAFQPNPFGGAPFAAQKFAPGLPPGAEPVPGTGGNPRPIRPVITHTGPPKLDRHGDPLPAGAVARFGTVRLRHGAQVQAMAFTFDGKLLCTISATEDSVKLWDTTTGKEVARLNTTATLVGLANNGSAVVIDEARCKVWIHGTNTTRDLPEKTLPEGSNPTALAVNPDSKSFAVAVNGKVLLIDTQTGKTIRELNLPGIPGNNPNAKLAQLGGGNPPGENNPQQPAKLLYSPDGRWLVGNGARTGVWLWDLRTGKRVRTYRTEIDFPEYTFSPDVTKIAITGERLHLYPLDAEEPVEGFKGPEGGLFHAPRFSADGKTLFLMQQDGSVLPLDAATGEEKESLDPPEMNLRPPFALASQGTMAASLDQSGGIRIWDPKTGKGPEVNRLPGLFDAAFSADGKSVTVLDMANKLHTFDPATGAPGKVIELDFPDDGLPTTWDARSRRAATIVPSGEEVEVHVIDADTKKVISKHAIPPNVGFPIMSFASNNRDRMALFCQFTILVVNPTTGKPVRTINTNQQDQQVRGSISPDGRLVAGIMRGVTVWEVATGKKRFSFDTTQNPEQVVFSPDSRFLAIWDNTGTIAIYDLRTGASVRKFPISQGDTVSAMAFSHDGKRLAAADHVGRVTVWDASTGDVLAPFPGHDGMVSCLTFSTDGKRLLSSSHDGTALVWEVPEKPQAPGPVEAAVTGFDEAFRLLGSGDGVQAQRGMDYLYRRPADAVKQISDRIVAPAATPAAKITQYITDLDSEDFATREAATKALEGVGGEATPLLRHAVEKSTNAEVRKLATELLGKIDAPPSKPDDLKVLRVIEVLEGLRTPEARAVLEKWAGGPAGHRFTIEAATAFARLKANGGK